MSLQIKLPLLGRRGYKTKSQSSLLSFPHFSLPILLKKIVQFMKKIYLTLGYLLHICFVKSTVTSLFPLAKNRKLRFHVFDS